MNNKLILRTVPSPYGDATRGSVLSHEDVDNNFIFLKGKLIQTGSTGNNNLLLTSIDGSQIAIPLNFTGTTTGGTGGGASITAVTFDTNNTLHLFDSTGGTFTALINYLSGLTVNGNVLIGTTTDDGATKLQINGGIKVGDGLDASPSYSFLNYPNTGFHTNASGSPTGDIAVVICGNTVTSFRNNIVFTYGTFAPITNGTQTNGQYNQQWGRIYSTVFLSPFGTETNPNYNFQDGSDNTINNGMFATPAFLGFATITAATTGLLGVERMRINTAGNVMVNTKIDNGNKLQVAGTIQADALISDRTKIVVADTNGVLQTTNQTINNIDVFVTGGTYANGIALFTNNTGNTFSVSGFSIGGNGLSLSGSNIVLGNDVGRTDATLFSNREIPMSGFNIFYTGIGNIRLGDVTDDGSKFQIISTNVLNQTLISLKTSTAYTIATPVILLKNSANLTTFELRIAVNAGFTSTFLGKNSGKNCTANTNVGVGEDALAAVTNATSNVAVGFRALTGLTTGVSNVALGHASQAGMLIGSRNLSMGRTSILRATGGTSNIVFGDSAMQEASDAGLGNVVIGFTAFGAGKGDNNVVIGNGAMFYQNAIAGITRPSTQNIAIGYRASFTTQLGVNNIVLGTQANLSGILGDSNILIGSFTDSLSSITNTTIIGAGITTSLSNIAILGRADQNVIIGQTTPTVDNGAKIQVNGNMSLGVIISSASTLSLSGAASHYIYKGVGTTTWTLPTGSGKTGWTYFIKNRGSDIITLIPNGGDLLYTINSVSTLSINPGEAYMVIWDGEIWNIE